MSMKRSYTMNEEEIFKSSLSKYIRKNHYQKMNSYLSHRTKLCFQFSKSSSKIKHPILPLGTPTFERQYPTHSTHKFVSFFIPGNALCSFNKRSKPDPSKLVTNPALAEKIEPGYLTKLASEIENVVQNHLTYR